MLCKLCVNGYVAFESVYLFGYVRLVDLVLPRFIPVSCVFFVTQFVEHLIS